MILSLKLKALMALLSTVFLWSVYAVVARFAIHSVPPFFLLFARFLVAAIGFLPLVSFDKLIKKPHLYKLIGISILSTINVTFFILGIRDTTASTSQLIYAAMPILIILTSTLFLHESFTKGRIGGVIIGLMGICIIIYRSTIEKGTTITGSLVGNLWIIGAMLSWMMYILTCKKMSKYFTPIEIGSVSVFVSFLFSICLMLIELVWTRPKIHIGGGELGAMMYMGLGGTVVPYILLQFAVKHVSALTVSMSSYIQPVITTTLAMIFLGEIISGYFLLGSVLIISGVFLTTTLEMLQRRELRV